MGALPTLQTAVLDIAYLVRIPTPEHLVDKDIVVGLVVARVDAFEPVPVLGKDLFEAVPGRQGFCSHQAASLRSVGWCVIALFYHISPIISIPSPAFTGARSPTPLPL